MAPWFAVLLLCILQTVPYTTQQGAGRKECLTARKEPGTCINVKQCATLFELVNTRSKDPSTVQYLRGSQCGFEGRTAKVCCPDQQQQQPPSQPPQQQLHQRQPHQCGHSNPSTIRVIGGKTAELGVWPWIAALGYRTRSQPGPEWLCASALINTRYVVTAAHCIIGVSPWELYIVRVGDLNLDETVDDGATPNDVEVERTIAHEQYTANPVANDIALVRLRRPVQFTSLIQPICLPTAQEFRTSSLVDQDVFVAGWGRVTFNGPFSAALQDLRLPIVDTARCKQAYSAHRGANVDHRNICAGYLKGGKDTCQGDSGGPLMYLQNSVHYLIGIVSYGYKCAEPGYPGIYTKVAEFVDWISTHTN